MAIADAIPRPEFLQVAEAVAREKLIEREEVLEAMEEAMGRAGRQTYGQNKDIRAEIDRKTGAVKLSRWTLVVPDDAVIEDEEIQMPLRIAQKVKPGIAEGEYIIDPLPPIDFGRIGAQTAKQVIVQRVREVERRKQFEEYKDRVGEVINGTVKRTEYGNLMVDLGPGRGAAAPRRDHPARGLQERRPRARLHLRRARGAARAADLPVPHPSGLPGQAVRGRGAGNLRRHHRDQGGGARRRLARQDGRDLARQLDRPGGRLRRHARLARAGGGGGAPGREDRHHPWASDIATFIVNAMAPAEVSKVVLDDESKRVEVVVPTSS
jgi:N utilization substance protein A